MGGITKITFIAYLIKSNIIQQNVSQGPATVPFVCTLSKEKSQSPKQVMILCSDIAFLSTRNCLSWCQRTLAEYIIFDAVLTVSAGIAPNVHHAQVAFVQKRGLGLFSTNTVTVLIAIDRYMDTLVTMYIECPYIKFPFCIMPSRSSVYISHFY